MLWVKSGMKAERAQMMRAKRWTEKTVESKKFDPNFSFFLFSLNWIGDVNQIRNFLGYFLHFDQICNWKRIIFQIRWQKVSCNFLRKFLFCIPKITRIDGIVCREIENLNRTCSCDHHVLHTQQIRQMSGKKGKRLKRLAATLISKFYFHRK